MQQLKSAHRKLYKVRYPRYIYSASLIALLVKNPLAMQETLVRKIPWRRDRLPTLVFLGFPCGSAGKESICSVGGLG